MPFSKFVEIGRVAVLGDGPDCGKIAAIVNVIDQNRVLLDGPTSGVGRQAYPIKKLQLTPLKVNFAFNASTRVVRKEMEAEKVSLINLPNKQVIHTYHVAGSVYLGKLCMGQEDGHQVPEKWSE